MRWFESSQSLALAAGAPAASNKPKAALTSAVFRRIEARLDVRPFMESLPGAWPGLEFGMRPEDSNTRLVELLRCASDAGSARKKAPFRGAFAGPRAWPAIQGRPESGLCGLVPLRIVVMVVPVALIVPAMGIFIPPAVSVFPAIGARFGQFVAPVIRL